MHSLRKLSVPQIGLISPLIRSNHIRRQNLCTAKESTSENERTASFGFKTVRESEKADKGILRGICAFDIIFLFNCMQERER